jgi:hypothetical protein
MLAPVVHILPLTRIRRERLLPVPGKVLVRKGQKVATTDVVAEARLNPEHLLLNIARGLGMSEEKSDQYLQCKTGMKVSQGDVLAGPVGMTKRVVRAPKDGKVIVAGGGQILLELDSPPFELLAGLPGIVVHLIEERGVAIEATGTLIQGVWGNGRLDFGLMYVLMRTADDVLTPDRLDVSLRGSIILGGFCKDPEVLKTAAGLPIRALILASMDAALLPLAERMRYPILIVEGFGKRPMNTAAYNLLTTNERREVAVNAQVWEAYDGNRPEIIIPLPANVEPALPPETDTFVAGQQVRLARLPFQGGIGTIVEIRPGVTAMPSGINVSAAEVQLESGEKVLVPLANLEVIE